MQGYISIGHEMLEQNQVFAITDQCVLAYDGIGHHMLASAVRAVHHGLERIVLNA